MQKRKVEILAPAGSMESLKAAVQAGCDAVYLGGTLFSARAFAGNFDHEELKEAVRYCHIRDVSVYVTLNTLLFESEFARAAEEVKFLYENDVDALLVQDLGLFRYIRTCFPEFPVHCSTQMHIHNLSGVRFMKKMGASRIVLARETPIETVRRCCEEGIDIEAFVYGALCVSYSGQCLMSESLKHRSGNRGMCAQCCRLKYSYDESEGSYLLSPRDLNVVDRLPELLDAGVCSLKIEGRMKRPEYVYLVTRTVKEAVDAWQADRPYRISPKRMEELLLMFNRGFTEGHLFHASARQRMNSYRPNHLGVEIGKVIDYRQGKVGVKLSAPLYQHDGLRILNDPYDTGLTAVKIEKNGKLTDRADAGDTVWLECSAKPRPKKGQPLHKTSDAVLLDQISRKITDADRKTVLHVTCSAFPGEPLVLTAEDNRGHIVKAESSSFCQQAKNAPVTEEKLSASIRKTSGDPYEILIDEVKLGDVFLPVSLINETRRNLLAQVSEDRAKRYTRPKPLPYHCELQQKEQMPGLITISDREETKMYENEMLFMPYDGKDTDQKVMPVVNEEDDGKLQINNAVISSVGDLGHPLKQVIAGFTMNAANHYAVEFLLLQKGVVGVILSSELQNTQIRFLLDAFREAHGFEAPVWRLVYGKRTLMYIKDPDVFQKGAEEIRDIHGSVFQLVTEGNIVRLLEAGPYRSDNPFCGSCLILTDETEGERKKIREEAYEEFSGRI